MALCLELLSAQPLPSLGQEHQKLLSRNHNAASSSAQKRSTFLK